MKTVRVRGKNKQHEVILYALSTCEWCKKAKRFLADIGVEYEYVDVDLCSRSEREEIKRKVLEMGGRLSYPAIIVDEKTLINGFHEDKIKGALEC